MPKAEEGDEMKRLLLPLLLIMTLAACSRPGAEKPKTEGKAAAPSPAKVVGEQRHNAKTLGELTGKDMVGLFSEEALNYYYDDEMLQTESTQLRSLSSVHKQTVQEAIDQLQTLIITARTDERLDAIAGETPRVIRKALRAVVVLPEGLIEFLLMAACKTLVDLSFLRAVDEGRIDLRKQEYTKDLSDIILRYKLQTWPQSKRKEKVLEMGVKLVEQADMRATLLGI